MYWVSIVLFGLPLPGEALASCKGGWREYLRLD